MCSKAGSFTTPEGPAFDTDLVPNQPTRKGNTMLRIRRVSAILVIMAVALVALVACAPDAAHCLSSAASPPGDNTYVTPAPYSSGTTYTVTDTSNRKITPFPAGGHQTILQRGPDTHDFTDDPTFKNNVPPTTPTDQYAGYSPLTAGDTSGTLDNCVLGGRFTAASGARMLLSALSVPNVRSVVADIEVPATHGYKHSVIVYNNSKVTDSYLGGQTGVYVTKVGNGTGGLLARDVAVVGNFIESGGNSDDVAYSGCGVIGICTDQTTGVQSSDSTTGIIQIDQNRIYTRFGGFFDNSYGVAGAQNDGGAMSITNNVFFYDPSAQVRGDTINTTKRCDDSGRINPCHMIGDGDGFSPVNLATDSDHCTGNTLVAFNAVIDQSIKDAWTLKCPDTQFVDQTDGSTGQTLYNNSRTQFGTRVAPITSPSRPFTSA